MVVKAKAKGQENKLAVKKGNKNKKVFAEKNGVPEKKQLKNGAANKKNGAVKKNTGAKPNVNKKKGKVPQKVEEEDDDDDDEDEDDVAEQQDDVDSDEENGESDENVESGEDDDDEEAEDDDEEGEEEDDDNEAEAAENSDAEADSDDDDDAEGEDDDEDDEGDDDEEMEEEKPVKKEKGLKRKKETVDKDDADDEGKKKKKTDEFTIFIGGLNYDTEEDALQSFLEEQGLDVESVRIITDRETHKSKGFGYADLANEAEVKKALNLSEVNLDGRNLRFDRTQPKGDRSNTDAKSKKLFMANLAFSVTKEDLQEHFEDAEEVILLQKDGRSKGCGFLVFESDDKAAAVIKEKNGLEIEGREIKLEFAKPQGSFGGRGGGRGGRGGFGGGRGGRGGFGGGRGRGGRGGRGFRGGRGRGRY